MGDIMGGGLNEMPFLRYADKHMASMLRQALSRPSLDAKWLDSVNWPEEMRAEYGADEGTSAAPSHREKVANAFRTLRGAIDDFNPDVVLIWSKEQMENFGEDAMPPYAVYAYEELEFRPHRQAANLGPTIWGEDQETVVRVPSAREQAKYLAAHLIEQGFDTTYAYRPLHQECIAHTFEGLITHLDWDRRGFPYPVLPFYINGLGHQHLSARGQSREGEVDPPAPPPWRCYDLGKAVAEIFRDSRWRVALIAGSSWSHGFMAPSTNYIWPNIAADRILAKELQAGNYQYWRNLKRDDMISWGNQEIVSWVALAGACEAVDLKPTFFDVQETWCFASTKVTAVFK